MKNRGGMSTHYAQHVNRHRSILGTSFDIYIEREATLPEDLREVRSRYLRNVSIVLREGYSDELRISFAERDDVVALRDALNDALRATDDDQTFREAIA